MEKETSELFRLHHTFYDYLIFVHKFISLFPVSKTYHHDTLVAVGTNIYVYDRANVVRVYRDHSFPILGLFILGHYLLSYDTDNNIMVSTELSKYNLRIKHLVHRLRYLISNKE